MGGCEISQKNGTFGVLGKMMNFLQQTVKSNNPSKTRPCGDAFLGVKSALPISDILCGTAISVKEGI